MLAFLNNVKLKIMFIKQSFIPQTRIINAHLSKIILLILKKDGVTMVKGATRRIVEIKETGSQYFEKAIFFINMDTHKHTSESTLSQEAKKIIDSFSSEKRPYQIEKHHKKGQLFISIVKLVGSAAFGSFLTLLFTQIL